MRTPIASLLAASLALWAGVAFGHGTTLQLSPNGVNDTSKLQKALDSCTHAKAACRIVLARGVFYTDVLLAKDFNGSIRGQGRDKTIIRPLRIAPLRSTPRPFLKDPSLSQPYPVLLHFANGANVEMSDLTLDFPHDMRVAEWGLPYGLPDKLLAAIMVDGGRNDRARLEISRVAINAPRSPAFGSNVMNAVSFEGQTRATDPYDAVGRATPLASGELSARNVSINGTLVAFNVRDISNSQVSLIDNDLEDVLTSGFSFADLSQSRILVRKNRIAAASNGIRINRGVRFLGGVEQASKKSSAYVITQNTVNIETGDGITFVDSTQFFTTPGHGIDHVLVHDNDVVLAPEALTGVFVMGDYGNVTVASNTLWGPSAWGGIFINEGRGTRTWHNRFRDFGSDAIHVTLSPTTSRCWVSERGAKVQDDGVGNNVD